MFLFAGINPKFEISGTIKIINERISFLPINQFKLDKNKSKDYLVNSNWALYCDNYLEGFHIPFVHDDLNDVLDYGNYETIVYNKMNLQIGLIMEKMLQHTTIGFFQISCLTFTHGVYQ